MKYTAILHLGFTLAVIIGIAALSGPARLVAFGVGVILFVAGVVTARRDGSSDGAQ